MKRWLETQGHALCIWLAVKRVYHGQPWGWLETAWTTIWWRYYCPRPVLDNWTARACANGGHCGCSSGDRFRANQQTALERGKMKRLPIIRHLRYFYLRYQVNRHYDLWGEVGMLPVHAHHDYEVMDQIWRGER